MQNTVIKFCNLVMGRNKAGLLASVLTMAGIGLSLQSFATTDPRCPEGWYVQFTSPIECGETNPPLDPVQLSAVTSAIRTSCDDHDFTFVGIDRAATRAMDQSVYNHANYMVNLSQAGESFSCPVVGYNRQHKDGRLCQSPTSFTINVGTSDIIRLGGGKPTSKTVSNSLLLALVKSAKIEDQIFRGFKMNLGSCTFGSNNYFKVLLVNGGEDFTLSLGLNSFPATLESKLYTKVFPFVFYLNLVDDAPVECNARNNTFIRIDNPNNFSSYLNSLVEPMGSIWTSYEPVYSYKPKENTNCSFTYQGEEVLPSFTLDNLNADSIEHYYNLLHQESTKIYDLAINYVRLEKAAQTGNRIFESVKLDSAVCHQRVAFGKPAALPSCPGKGATTVYLSSDTLPVHDARNCLFTCVLDLVKVGDEDKVKKVKISGDFFGEGCSSPLPQNLHAVAKFDRLCFNNSAGTPYDKQRCLWTLYNADMESVQCTADVVVCAPTPSIVCPSEVESLALPSGETGYDASSIKLTPDLSGCGSAYMDNLFSYSNKEYKLADGSWAPLQSGTTFPVGPGAIRYTYSYSNGHGKSVGPETCVKNFIVTGDPTELPVCDPATASISKSVADADVTPVAGGGYSCPIAISATSAVNVAGYSWTSADGSLQSASTPLASMTASLSLGENTLLWSILPKVGEAVQCTSVVTLGSVGISVANCTNNTVSADAQSCLATGVVGNLDTPAATRTDNNASVSASAYSVKFAGEDDYVSVPASDLQSLQFPYGKNSLRTIFTVANDAGVEIAREVCEQTLNVSLAAEPACSTSGVLKGEYTAGDADLRAGADACHFLKEVTLSGEPACAIKSITYTGADGSPVSVSAGSATADVPLAYGPNTVSWALTSLSGKVVNCKASTVLKPTTEALLASVTVSGDGDMGEVSLDGGKCTVSGILSKLVAPVVRSKASQGSGCLEVVVSDLDQFSLDGSQGPLTADQLNGSPLSAGSHTISRYYSVAFNTTTASKTVTQSFSVPQAKAACDADATAPAVYEITSADTTVTITLSGSNPCNISSVNYSLNGVSGGTVADNSIAPSLILPVGSNSLEWTLSQVAGSSVTCRKAISVKRKPKNIKLNLVCPASPDFNLNTDDGVCSLEGLITNHGSVIAPTVAPAGSTKPLQTSYKLKGPSDADFGHAMTQTELDNLSLSAGDYTLRFRYKIDDDGFSAADSCDVSLHIVAPVPVCNKPFNNAAFVSTDAALERKLGRLCDFFKTVSLGGSPSCNISSVEYTDADGNPVSINGSVAEDVSVLLSAGSHSVGWTLNTADGGSLTCSDTYSLSVECTEGSDYSVLWKGKSSSTKSLTLATDAGACTLGNLATKIGDVDVVFSNSCFSLDGTEVRYEVDGSGSLLSAADLNALAFSAGSYVVDVYVTPTIDGVAHSSTKLTANVTVALESNKSDCDASQKNKTLSLDADATGSPLTLGSYGSCSSYGYQGFKMSGTNPCNIQKIVYSVSNAFGSSIDEDLPGGDVSANLTFAAGTNTLNWKLVCADGSVVACSRKVLVSTKDNNLVLTCGSDPVTGLTASVPAVSVPTDRGEAFASGASVVALLPVHGAVASECFTSADVVVTTSVSLASGLALPVVIGSSDADVAAYFASHNLVAGDYSLSYSYSSTLLGKPTGKVNTCTVPIRVANNAPVFSGDLTYSLGPNTAVGSAELLCTGPTATDASLSQLSYSYYVGANTSSPSYTLVSSANNSFSSLASPGLNLVSFRAENANGDYATTSRLVMVIDTALKTCADVTWHGQQLAATGVYSYLKRVKGTLQNPDTALILDYKRVAAISNQDNPIDTSVCEEPFLWNGISISESDITDANNGVFSYQTTAASGCDSTVYIKVAFGDHKAPLCSDRHVFLDVNDYAGADHSRGFDAVKFSNWTTFPFDTLGIIFNDDCLGEMKQDPYDMSMTPPQKIDKNGTRVNFGLYNKNDEFVSVIGVSSEKSINYFDQTLQDYYSIPIRPSEDQSVPAYVKFTATDKAGNSSVCRTYITVRDTVAPKCKDSVIVANIGPDGLARISSDSLPRIIDNRLDAHEHSALRWRSADLGQADTTTTASLLSLTFDPSAGTSTTIFWTIVDTLKTSYDACKSTVVFMDTTPPKCSITIGDEVSVGGDDCKAIPNVEVSMSDNMALDKYSYSVVVNGSTSSTAGKSDNKSDISISSADPTSFIVHNPVAALGEDSYVITVTVTDTAGKIGQCKEIFQIEGSNHIDISGCSNPAKPLLVPASSCTVSSLADSLPALSAVVKKCDGSLAQVSPANKPTVSYFSKSADDGAFTPYASEADFKAATFSPGEYDVKRVYSLSASQSSAATSSFCTQHVVVEDKQKPVLSSGMKIYRATLVSGSTSQVKVVIALPEGKDNCSSKLDYSFMDGSASSPSFISLGPIKNVEVTLSNGTTTTMTAKVADMYGNEQLATLDVTVTDTAASSCSSFDWRGTTLTKSGAYAMAVDAETVKILTLTIGDAELPTCTALPVADQLATSDCGVDNVDAEVQVSDNCLVKSIVYSGDLDGSISAIAKVNKVTYQNAAVGNRSIYWTVTDYSGNMARCTTQFKVLDAQPLEFLNCGNQSTNYVSRVGICGADNMFDSLPEVVLVESSCSGSKGTYDVSYQVKKEGSLTYVDINKDAINACVFPNGYNSIKTIYSRHAEPDKLLGAVEGFCEQGFFVLDKAAPVFSAGGTQLSLGTVDKDGVVDVIASKPAATDECDVTNYNMPYECQIVPKGAQGARFVSVTANNYTADLPAVLDQNVDYQVVWHATDRSGNVATLTKDFVLRMEHQEACSSFTFDGVERTLSGKYAAIYSGRDGAPDTVFVLDLFIGDTEAPVVSLLSGPMSFDVTKDCSVSPTIKFTGTDNCMVTSATAWVDGKSKTFTSSSGKNSATFTAEFAAGTMKIGKHPVLIKVIDKHNNEGYLYDTIRVYYAHANRLSGCNTTSTELSSGSGGCNVSSILDSLGSSPKVVNDGCTLDLPACSQYYILTPVGGEASDTLKSEAEVNALSLSSGSYTLERIFIRPEDTTKFYRGSVKSCVQPFSVADKVKPVLTGSLSLGFVKASASDGMADVSLMLPKGSDNCTAAALLSLSVKDCDLAPVALPAASDSAVLSLEEGKHSIVFSVSDALGNVSQQSCDITVTQTTTQSCKPVSWLGKSYSTTGVYVVKSGAFEVGILKLTMADDEAPVCTASAAADSFFISSGCSTSAKVNLSVSDNCSLGLLSWSLDGATAAAGSESMEDLSAYTATLTGLSAGAHTVSFSLLDGYGNKGTCSAVVNVYEKIPMSASASSDAVVTVNSLADKCGADGVADSMASVSVSYDGCSAFKIDTTFGYRKLGTSDAYTTLTRAEFNKVVLPVGSYQIEQTFVRSVQPADFAVQTKAVFVHRVSVVDKVAPKFTGGALGYDFSVDAVNGKAEVSVSFPPAEDACPGSLSYSYVVKRGDGTSSGRQSLFAGVSQFSETFALGLNTVTVYAADQSNNLDSIVGTMAVVDTLAQVCDSLQWHGKWYHGGYYAARTSADTTKILHLTVFEKSKNDTIVKTACSVYEGPDGKALTESGVYSYNFTNQYGCDSIVVLDLTIAKPFAESVNKVVCSSFTWDVDGKTYTASGTYEARFKSVYGCDSVYTLNLVVNQPKDTTIYQKACLSYEWKGKTLNASGYYKDTLATKAGCDSVVTLALTISSPRFDTLPAVTECESYTWHGKAYTQSGVYSYVLPRESGEVCDHTESLPLTIIGSEVSNIEKSACDSFVWMGTKYDKTGNYTRTIPSSRGCDSTITLHLTINKSSYETLNEVACGAYSWQILGRDTLLTKGGRYKRTFKGSGSSAGCVNTEVLNLTVNMPADTTFFDSITIGQGYSKHGFVKPAEQLLKQENEYVFIDTLLTSLGCDSIVTLRLFVMPKPEIHFCPEEPVSMAGSGGFCNDSSVSLSFCVDEGNAESYRIDFSDEALALHFKPVEGSISGGNVVSFPIPAGATPGSYTGYLSLKGKGLANYSEKQPFQFSVNFPGSLIVKYWNDVVVCNRNGTDFVRYQWNKNGVDIPLATRGFYEDIDGGVVGDYGLTAWDSKGNRFEVCPRHFTAATTPATLIVNPSPCKANVPFTVTVIDIEADNLANAHLFIYDAQGVLMRTLLNVQEENEFILPTGAFVVALSVDGGNVASAKVIVTP